MIRFALLIFAVVLGACATSIGARAQDEGSGPAGLAEEVLQLKNVAAADAVAVYYRRTGDGKRGVNVAAEPVTNTVLVSGEVSRVERALRMLVEIDKSINVRVAGMANGN